jgi:AcrR family transcriptional regulator
VRRHSLSNTDVAAAVDAVLADAADRHAAATITALAKQLDVSRQTLYRDFPDHVADFQTRDVQQRERSPVPRPRRQNNDEDTKTIKRLREERDELQRHVEIYEEHIRRLTVENERLTEALQTLSGVTNLRDLRPVSALPAVVGLPQ